METHSLMLFYIKYLLDTPNINGDKPTGDTGRGTLQTNMADPV